MAFVKNHSSRIAALIAGSPYHLITRALPALFVVLI